MWNLYEVNVSSVQVSTSTSAITVFHRRCVHFVHGHSHNTHTHKRSDLSVWAVFFKDEWRENGVRMQEEVDDRNEDDAKTIKNNTTGKLVK